VASPECSAPPRRAGPLGSLQVASAGSPSSAATSALAWWTTPWSWARQVTQSRLPRLSWRTVLAVLVVLLFPRLIALTIAITLRLVAKAVMNLASHVLRELWFQLNATAAEIEDALVDWLYMDNSALSIPTCRRRSCSPPLLRQRRHLRPRNRTEVALPSQPGPWTSSRASSWCSTFVVLTEGGAETEVLKASFSG